MTITDFLLAQIAKDEAVARTAQAESPTPWENADGTLYDAGVRTIAGYAGGDTAPHILRHAPDRVLAECEAKRRIVELHQSWPVLVETPPNLEVVASDDPSTIAVRTSKRLAWLTEQEYRARFGDEPPTAPMLRALASVYADHPDFDLAWRAE